MSRRAPVETTLFLSGGSALGTPGAANPTLTIVALALAQKPPAPEKSSLGTFGPSAAYAARSNLVSADSHRGQIVDAISIRERPAEIADRAIPGHWEGDPMGGAKNNHIATLVERHSRFTALVKVRSKDTAVVVAALSRQVRKLPASLRRSLTWDRGLEMAKHQTFTAATNVKSLLL